MPFASHGLRLNGHSLAAHRFLHVKPEDKSVEVTKPRVLSILYHSLTSVCDIESTNSSLQADIPERRVEGDRFFIVLQQGHLPRSRSKCV